MPYEFYKVLHLTGIFLLISGLIGAFVTTWSGQALTGKIKTFSFAMHGMGLLFILVSGFGLLARLGLTQGLPVWAYIKLGIWGLFALAISLLKRKGQLGWPLYSLLIIVYLVAVYSAIYKPA